MKTHYQEDAGLTEVPESVLGIKGLEVLSLYKNLIHLIPEELLEIRSLKRLNLSANKIEILPNNIGNLSYV